MREVKDRLITDGKIAFAALLVLVVLSTIYAERGRYQTSSARDSVKYSGRLRTVPTSGSKVTLRLTFDDGAVFVVTQLEGAAIRVERNGSTTGIIAHIDPEQKDRVAADVFKVVPIEVQGVLSGERIADLTSVGIGPEGVDITKGDLSFKVEVAGIGIAPRVIPSKVSFLRFRPQGGGGGGECCVTCNGVRVCGCAVEAACGSCCCSPCCDGGLS